MKLINKHNLAVAFAASTEESRYTLQAILATENETVATDGHILARVSMPAVEANSFPVVEGFKANGFTRGLIPTETAKEIQRSIPKVKHLPILNHAAISAEHAEDGSSKLKVAVTDLDSPKVFSIKPVEGTFPNWDGAIWPAQGKEPAMDVCFDVSLLKRLTDAAAKFSDRNCKPIRLRFYSKDSAMRFDMVNDDGQELNGLVMPLRSDVNPTFKA